MHESLKIGRTLGAATIVALIVGAAAGLCRQPTQQAKLVASDAAASDFFGTSVSLDGDTAVVGANGKSQQTGAAYVFTRAGEVWTPGARLVPTGVVAGDRFGDSVSLSGDSVLVGAGGDDGSPGAAYVFTRDGGGVWTQQQKLVAADAVSGDSFGLAVALSGDTALVGAYRKNLARGAAYVFTRTGTTWTQQAKLLPSDPAESDFFGGAVSLDGDTAVVASAFKDVGQGAAYVFTRSGATWTQQAKLVASDGEDGDFFGESVSLDGNTVVVGADFENHAPPSDAFQGAAYVFTRSGTTWTQQQKLVAPDPADGDFFGEAVALSGDAVVVGAYGKNFLQGAAYVFTRGGGTWTLLTKLVADDPADDASFAFAAAYADGSILIGASGLDTNRGAAYVFTGLTPPPAVPYLLPTKVKARVNAAHPQKSALSVSGTIDTGPDAPDFTGAATFDVGAFHLDVPAFVGKNGGKSLTYAAGGATFSIKPAANGSSRATFTLKAVADLGAGFDPDAALALKFANARYDARATVKLKAGALAPRAVVAPDLAVVRAAATIKGGGKDALALTAGFAATGVAPPSPETLTVCFGNAFSVDLPASAFRAKGATSVLVAKTSGITKATVDYAKGVIAIAGKGLDLGVFADGGNAVGVTITLGGVDHEAQVRMSRVKTKLAY